MKKFFLILCLSTATINAMDDDKTSLAQDIINVYGKQGIITTNSNPENTLFGVMRTISKHQQQEKNEKTGSLTTFIAAVCSIL